ncbi:MAG: PilZ domain-containing protein [Limnochordaceae bacterium]|nr:PilZ domain-containing protein [Limnochordaceae bacterium]
MKWVNVFRRPLPSMRASEEGPSQRRLHYRLPIMLPFVWRLIPGEGVGNASDYSWSQAVTHDLSAGGLSFLAADRSIGERLQLRLPLPDGEVSVTGEIIRLQPLGDAPRPTGEQMVGIRFIDLSPRAEQQIVRYIFQVESSRRRLQEGTD